MLLTILLVVLILAAIGAMPVWPHSQDWGPYPASGLWLLVVILLILILTHNI